MKVYPLELCAEDLIHGYVLQLHLYIKWHPDLKCILSTETFSSACMSEVWSLIIIIRMFWRSEHISTFWWKHNRRIYIGDCYYAAAYPFSRFYVTMTQNELSKNMVTPLMKICTPKVKVQHSLSKKWKILRGCWS